MATIKQYFDYSTLSLAAYGIDLLPNTDISTKLKSAGMAQAQFDQFIADGWEVVDQSSDAKYGTHK